jgi:hypothetical protein
MRKENTKDKKTVKLPIKPMMLSFFKYLPKSAKTKTQREGTAVLKNILCHILPTKINFQINKNVKLKIVRFITKQFGF